MRITETPTNNRLVVSASHRNHIISPHIQPPCINTNNTMLIAAKPNYGKSSLVQSMLKRKRQYRCAFDHVYLVCPPASRKAFKSDVFCDHSEEKQFDSLDDDTIDILEAELEKNNAASDDPNDPVHTLWIFDDVQASLREHERRLLHILSSYRHRNLSVWILMQSWMAAPKKIRDVCRSVIQFKMSSGKEIETFAEEVLPGFSPPQIKQLLKYVYRDRHDFTWVDREKNTLTRNMDFLHVQDSDDEDG
jgi:hypothetical protein